VPALAATGLGAKSKQIEAELQAILFARGVTLKQLEASPETNAAIVEQAQEASRASARWGCWLARQTHLQHPIHSKLAAGAAG
jgi:hypothetical protein